MTEYEYDNANHSRRRPMRMQVGGKIPSWPMCKQCRAEKMAHARTTAFAASCWSSWKACWLTLKAQTRKRQSTNTKPTNWADFISVGALANSAESYRRNPL